VVSAGTTLLLIAMRCAPNVVVLASIVASVQSLLLSHSGREVASNRRGVPTISTGDPALPNNDTFHDDLEVESFYACASSNCTVNKTKIKAELSSGLIMFLGCSLDIYAIKHFCTAAQATLIGFENNFAYMSYCTMGGFTLVYVFQPGATAPPYWKDYVGTLTSQQIVTQSTQDVVQRFGREPTAIVVDSSLWDVSSWWQRLGMPLSPYPASQSDITRWCHTDLPQLLQFVADSYPRSQIGFRTAAPVFTPNEYGQQPEIVNEMTRCVRGQLDFMTQKVFGKYQLIDFNKLIEEFMLHHAHIGPRLSFYNDVLHPGRQLSMAYMNSVLKWVRGFHHPS